MLVQVQRLPYLLLADHIACTNIKKGVQSCVCVGGSSGGGGYCSQH